MTRPTLLACALLVSACGGATPLPSEPVADVVAPSARGRLTAGRAHACLALESGEVLCWGANDRGQLGDATRWLHSSPAPVTGLDDAVQVVAGHDHTCALRRGGEVACWGAGLRGQLGDGSEGEAAQAIDHPVAAGDLDDVEGLTAGAYHTCALRRGGRVSCWGDDQAGQLGDGPEIRSTASPRDLELTGVRSIAAGDFHTCVLDAAGTARCWGQGDEGQLGTGHAEASSFPVDVEAPEPFVEIVAGRAHTCARGESGAVFCWGTDAHGQLGNGRGDAERTMIPSRVEELTDVVALAAGADHTCARLTNHEVHCWGANASGQLGDGTLLSAHHPVPGPVSAVDVATGRGHTCALHDRGMVTCWGDNTNGQLGDGRIAWRWRPAPIHATRGARAIAAGGNHSCALRSTAAVCWGSNGEGQLGAVSDPATSSPVAAIFATEPEEVSLALGRTCVREEGGLVICAGHGADAPERLVTVELAQLGPIRQIAVARDFACALNEEGAIGCWGDNARGQLGDGTLARRDAPTPVEGAGDAREVAVGAAHACARLVSGAVFCWGANQHGQLGDGTNEDRAVPTRVAELEDAEALSLGRDHSCALRRDHTVACWGGNRSGQLGDGTTTARATAAPVRGLTEVASVSAGWVHTCARVEGGRVACWGENGHGQLGRETEGPSSPSPAPIEGLPSVEQLASGGLHTCARAGGEVWCWGANAHGELGDGVTLRSTRPVMSWMP